MLVRRPDRRYVGPDSSTIVSFWDICPVVVLGVSNLRQPHSENAAVVARGGLTVVDGFAEANRPAQRLLTALALDVLAVG